MLQRQAPALEALLCLEPRRWPTQVRDATVAEVDQVLGHDDSSGPLVDTDRERGAARLPIVEDDGDPILRTAAKIEAGVVMADHNHRLRSGGHHVFKGTLDGISGHVRQRGQDGAASRCTRSRLDADHRAGRSVVAQIGDDDPDDSGPAGQPGPWLRGCVDSPTPR